MKQDNYKRRGTAMTIMLIGFAALGCQSDGPMFLDGDTRIIEGVLQTDQVSDTHFFTLTSSGTVNILATSVAAADPETGEPIENPLLGISVGGPDPANAEVCQLTFSQVVPEGGSFSVYFREGFFCVSVFRSVGLGETSILSYVVTMAGAFS